MKKFQNKTKIARFSQALTIILFLGFFVWAFMFFACVLPWIRMKPFGPIQVYVWTGWILQPVLGFMVNLKLFQFFYRLNKGFLFDAQTVGYLGAAGNWWLVYWIYQALFLGGRTVFFGVAMTWDWSCLFGALALIFVAWVFREAQGLQEEQELTV